MELSLSLSLIQAVFSSSTMGLIYWTDEQIIVERKNIDEIVQDLRDRATTSPAHFCENRLHALVNYSEVPNMLCHLSKSPVIEAVVDSGIFALNSATISYAITFLLNLSESYSYNIASSANAVSCLLNTLTSSSASASTEDRDNAALVLYNLALDPRVMYQLGVTDGLMHELVAYWTEESRGGTQIGRQNAGMALKELLRNKWLVKKLVEEAKVEKIMKLATNRMEGDSLVRRVAFKVLRVIACSESGVDELLKENVVDEMVGMLEEKEMVNGCLDVLREMHRLLKYEFIEVVRMRELNLKDALIEMLNDVDGLLDWVGTESAQELFKALKDAEEQEEDED